MERPYSLAEAREGLRMLMSAQPTPTAIVCGNDVLALGALLEAQKLGIKVLQALSSVGFDDLEGARHVQPALTTLHVPTQLPRQADSRGRLCPTGRQHCAGARGWCVLANRRLGKQEP